MNAPGLLPLPAEAGPGPLPGRKRRGSIVDDEQNPNDEEHRDALEAAAVLDDDALARIEVATQVAEAAEVAEDQAVAEGDFAEAERIDQEANEVISELVVEAAVEAETAEDMVEAALSTPVDEGAAAPDEDVGVVPDAVLAPAPEPEPADK